MNKLFIIHYYPIDYFPPVTNLINSLEENVDISVSTIRKSNTLTEYSSKKARILRCLREDNKRNTLLTLTKYLLFTIYTLGKLMWNRPDVVLYYESISALPAYLYRRFVCSKVKICIHYHEYMTQSEYDRPGMRLAKTNHKLEYSYLYQRASWISHTNEFRNELFQEDCPNVPTDACKLLPNYPPQKWLRKSKSHTNDVVKCVYVGSLSLKDTYVLEFCQWISRQQGTVQFDIYSFNFHPETLETVNSLHSPYIHFHSEGVKYSEIPYLLDRYDVGVLLYKAHTMNVKYCETNKFYEYLVCGLDVWYPKEMTLLHEMNKSVFAPQIVEMDVTQGVFPNLGLSPRQVDNSSYDRFCEKVYESFWTNIGDLGIES